MTAPPLVAGRFEVLGRLGSGSSGEVLRVRDRDGGRILALKLLRPEGVADPAQLARAFHREFHILAALRHPHLVAVHEHGVIEEADGAGGAEAAWFTMDLVPGRPIDAALKGAQAAVIARVADALLDALGALHRRGLVHGDVKAANILVGDEPGADPPPVTLVDLGLAARAGRAEPGVLRGTPATLAPEALRGAAPDGRADLYALGCVLYRVVTGQDPFLGADAWEVVRAHLALAPTPPRDLVPGVAPLLEQLILALLEKDPARRPPTAEEARRRLAPLSGAAAAPAVALAAPLAAELVGRGPQLASWREALAAHGGRGGGLWTVRGPTGSGRSRLLEEFLLEAHAAGRPAVLVGPHEAPPRPLGLIDAMERALARQARAAGPADEGATRAERLASRLAGAPLVLLIDDADDADPASCEVLQALAANAASGAIPALVALALREGGPPGEPLCATPPGAGAIALPPLGDGDAVRALASMVGAAALPPAWTAELALATSGRPAALAAVAEALVATGRVGPELPLAATLEAALAGAPATATVPEQPEARALVAALAVAGGGPLALAELEQLEPRAARDPAALDALLAAGTVRRVVDADGRVGLALAPRLAAGEALALASPAARAALHARRAEQLAGTADREEERGRHLAAIGRAGEARALFATAAARALEDGLPRAAARLADDALALPGAERDAAQAAGLRRTRAAALAALGFPREAAAEAAHAVEAARAAAEPRALADALRGAAALAGAGGDLAAAVAHLEEALALLDELGEVGLGAEVLLDEGRALARAGRAADGETRIASALGQARRAGRGDVETGALVALGELALAGGRNAEALSRFHAAEERARAAGGGAAGAAARRGRALALEAGGRVAEALEETTRLLAEARAAHRLDDEAEAAALAGRLLARLGRRREAQDALRTAAARRRRLGQPHEAAALAAREALLLLERGQLRAALALAREARAEAERCGVAAPAAEARAALATIAAARGEVEEVEALLPLRGDAPLPEQALRALLRGRALAVRGDGEAARGALQESCFLARRAGAERLELEGLLALAEASLERGDDERTQLALRRARQAAEATGWDEGVARARLLAAERELARGRGGAAAARDDARSAATVLAAHERGDLVWRALAAEAEAARLADAGADAALRTRDARQALEAFLAAAPDADRGRLAAHPRARALAGAPELPTDAARGGPGPPAPGPGGEAAPDGRTLHEPELERLLAINRALNSSLEPRAVLSILVDTAIELTGAERGFVLLDQQGESLVEIARGSGGAELDGAERELARGVARGVMQEGRPLLALDALTDARLAASASIHALAIRSLLAAPLAVRGEAAGAIVLDSRRAAAAFEPRHLELVGRLADQAGIALGNARLVDELRRQADEIRRLNEQLAKEVEEQRIEILEKQSSLEVRFRYDSLVGASPAMQRVYRILDKIVPTEIPVLITGESGTGKDLVARVVHYNGPRREQRFVAVNCAALTETLLESELFGHRRGAYTGADRDRKGLFEQADGGTLFLDEIGEMPMHLQPKLLRAIQFGEIRRLGEDLPRQVNVRIVAATNRELAAAVRDGRFREDLLYRLDVARVHLAPLRERIEDVGLLVDAILEGLATRSGAPAKRLEPAALRLFLRHRWPGNVRELEHELTKLAAFVDGELITELDVLENCAFHERAVPAAGSVEEGPVATLEQTEVEQIRQALRAARGNRSRAAEMLGIDRSTLYRKLRRLGDLEDPP